MRCAVLSLVLATTCFHQPTLAFNPPVDTSGPLTVRIEGPSEIDQVDEPLEARIVVKSEAAGPVEGTLQVKLIDQWRVEPAGPIRFAVDPGKTASYPLKISPAEKTYNAHYPVHVYALFEFEGKTHKAHPILILEVKRARPPTAEATVAWKPLAISSPGKLALCNTSRRRMAIRVFGQEPRTLVADRQHTDPRTGASAHVGDFSDNGKNRRALFVHPPWRDGQAGALLVEFPLALPEVKPLQLRFANAMAEKTQSDGVTFRVRVLPWDAPEGEAGRVVYERHVVSTESRPGEADLSPFAGQAVRLQLESHPGPKNNTGWDLGCWVEPTMVAGNPSVPSSLAETQKEKSRLLGTIVQGDRKYEVRFWPGRRGVFDAVVGFIQEGKTVCFHGFEAVVLGDRLDEPGSPTLLLGVEEEPCPGGFLLRHRLRSPDGPYDLVVRLTVEQGALKAHFALENTPPSRPWFHVYLEDVAAGSWNRPVRQLYAGHGNVIREPESDYDMGFDGHRLSTSFVGFDFDGAFSLVQGVDTPCRGLSIRPAGRHYSIHAMHRATLTFIPAEDVWEGVTVWRGLNGLQPAGGVKKLAGRFVFDLWGGHYAESAEALEKAFRYGLTDAAVVWHDWQRWGYDYRLPNIFPPNPHRGTLEDMQMLCETCRRAGVPFAPHDNYIDFYPDADGFSYERDIAFHADGRPVRAWLNEGRDAQSYRYRADRIEPFLRPNVEVIRDQFKPTGYFIDVWASICPYDYWTADGRFFDRIFTRDTWARQFDWIRQRLGGSAPQISESGHDQLIGHLDGGQTNHFRVGRPVPGSDRGWCVIDIRCADAERTPWFDAAHHDRFVLHGAGYPGRYEGGLDPKLHGIYSDDYMATEVLTGHPAMVPHPFSRNVVRKYWLLHDLMRALAMERVERVDYVGGDLHRQRVHWSSGGEVWVNRGRTDWSVEGVVLPQYGFLARVPTEGGTVETSLSRRDGILVEKAITPTMLYVNGRQVVGGPARIRPVVKEVRRLGGRGFEMALRWEAEDPIPEGYVPFLHLVDSRGEILFQAGHAARAFDQNRQGTIQATARGHVPESLKPGQSVELRIGLYRPGDGHRLALTGPDDGTRRIRMGTLRIEGEGDTVSGVAWKGLPPRPDHFSARQNPEARPIDFGPVVTAGGFRLTRDGRALVITPLPHAAGPTIPLRLRPAALPWKMPEPTHVETLDTEGHVVVRQPVTRQQGVVLIESEPGVFAYRLVGEEAKPAASVHLSGSGKIR